MIEINFVPKNLRKKKKASMLPGGVTIPLEVIIGLGGGLLLMLVFVHIILVALNIQKVSAHKTLQKEWTEIAPGKNNVEQVLQQMRLLQSKVKAIDDVTKRDGIIWARQLNLISDHIQRGVWLNKIEHMEGRLYIDGSGIAREDRDQGNVFNYVSALKRDKDFIQHLSEFELGNIQTRVKDKIEVSDFVITSVINE